jgi:hypothetical protein
MAAGPRDGPKQQEAANHGGRAPKHYTAASRLIGQTTYLSKNARCFGSGETRLAGWQAGKLTTDSQTPWAENSDSDGHSRAASGFGLRF